MKRSLPLFFLLLLSVQPSFAIRDFMGQFYGGAAKPPAEVTRIRLKNNVVINAIDNRSLGVPN